MNSLNPHIRLAAVALFAMVMAIPALAQGPRDESREPLVFDSPEKEDRYNDLILELRCLVCQNQNLADSDAPLAQQLRREIFSMLEQGQSNEEITGFMVDRYGDFVLYKPPVQSNTLILWAFPGLMLLIGGGVVFLSVRNRSRKLAAAQQGDSTP